MVPGTVTDFYLLVTSDPSDKIAPVRMQIIDAGIDRLRAGQMLWFNMTGYFIGGRLGSANLAIKPKSSVLLAPVASGHGDYPVELS